MSVTIRLPRQSFLVGILALVSDSQRESIRIFFKSLFAKLVANIGCSNFSRAVFPF